MSNEAIPLEESTLADLAAAMQAHKMECGHAFHRNCLEFIILGQHYVLQGGTLQTWNPLHPDSVVNNEFYVLTPESRVFTDEEINTILSRRAEDSN